MATTTATRPTVQQTPEGSWSVQLDGEDVSYHPNRKTARDAAREVRELLAAGHTVPAMAEALGTDLPTEHAERGGVSYPAPVAEVTVGTAELPDATIHLLMSNAELALLAREEHKALVHARKVDEVPPNTPALDELNKRNAPGRPTGPKPERAPRAPRAPRGPRPAPAGGWVRTVDVPTELVGTHPAGFTVQETPTEVRVHRAECKRQPKTTVPMAEHTDGLPASVVLPTCCKPRLPQPTA